MKFLEQKSDETPEKFSFLPLTGPFQVAQGFLDNIIEAFYSTAVYFKQGLRSSFKSVGSFGNALVKKNSYYLRSFQVKLVNFHDHICSLGVTDALDESTRRRLSLLNQITILQFITCLLIPFLALFKTRGISISSFCISLGPVFVSALVLTLNSLRKYNSALLCYFILFPFATCLIYMDGMNLGMGLNFVMYGILAVFFLKEISHMILSVSFSMISYFMLVVVIKNYTFHLKDASPGFYYFNQVVAIIFIFYGLYLIMKENTGYQGFILKKNQELEKVNLEIEQKNEIISVKAHQLEIQTSQLTALNDFQTKLFSIISHDLRAPVFALRDLFNNAAGQQISAEDVKELIPDAANDLSYTASLMENLLQWAKSQLQASERKPQILDISLLIQEVMQLLRLQAESKKVHLENRVNKPVHVFADKDMISVVIRNLVSNAVKFTPANGRVVIETNQSGSTVEVFVKDNGGGMSIETLQKINASNFFTTKGTANESGTGLGLMLCKEFLTKNEGRMFVESTEGKGSVFSFSLPAGE
jgi:signal transduction histidine kinase